MLVILKSTHRCNLRCSYCYAADHKGEENRTLREVFDQTIERLKEFGHLDQSKLVVHGGEPLLTDKDTLDHILSHPITAAIQTNLTLMDGDHVEMFKRHGTCVSSSFDGIFPGVESHRPGMDKTRRNMLLARAEGVKVNAIAVLTNQNTMPVDRLNTLHKQLLNYTDHYQYSMGVGHDQLSPDAYAEVMLYLFRKSLPLIVEGSHDVQPFTSMLENVSGAADTPQGCNMNGCQLHPIVGIMPNGDYQTCCRTDEYGPFGSVFDTTVEEYLNHPVKQELRTRYGKLAMGQCAGCEVFGYCHGGCLGELDPETGVTYGCKAIKRIYSYVMSGQMERDFPLYNFTTWAEKRKKRFERFRHV